MEEVHTDKIDSRREYKRMLDASGGLRDSLDRMSAMQHYYNRRAAQVDEERDKQLVTCVFEKVKADYITFAHATNEYFKMLGYVQCGGFS